MKHVISALVENQFGVLARVAGLFSARGYNIESLAVGPTEDPSASRMTIYVSGDEKILEQIMKQLHRLIDVISVTDLDKHRLLERELALVKVRVEPNRRQELFQIAEVFRAEVIDISPSSLTFQSVGPSAKIEALIELLQPYGIAEVSRTGAIATEREANRKK